RLRSRSPSRRLRPRLSTLFPYTTLFRSAVERFEQKHPHELMGKGQPGDRQQQIAGLFDLIRQAMRRADDEADAAVRVADAAELRDRKSTRLNSSHVSISYAVFCLKKKSQ